METKQTSVEWLEEKILNYDFNQGMSQMRKYILQAKQMEKEQTGEWVETHWYEEINGKNYKLYYSKNNERK